MKKRAWIILLLFLAGCYHSVVKDSPKGKYQKQKTVIIEWQADSMKVKTDTVKIK